MEGNRPDRFVSLLLGAVAGISIGISILDIIGILTGWAARLTPFFVGILLLYVVLERERVESIKYIVRRLDKGIDRVNATINRLQGARRTSDGKRPGALYREIPFKGMIFRSKTEVRIARALEHAGVVYLPPTKARLNTSSGRQGREIDFLVFHGGRWGMLEVDGPWHTPGSDAQRDALMRANGLTHIQRFDADRCYRQPDLVVAEFIAALTNQQGAPQSPPVQ
jgi:hypothetical protein